MKSITPKSKIHSECSSAFSTELCRFWNDQSGFIVTIELILIATITGIGLIVGLTCVRDALVSEMADVAEAIDEMDFFGDDASSVSAGNSSPEASAADSCISFNLPPTDER